MNEFLTIRNYVPESVDGIIVPEWIWKIVILTCWVIILAGIASAAVYLFGPDDARKEGKNEQNTRN